MKNWLLSIGTCLLGMYLVISTIVSLFVVKNAAMEPFVNQGDLIWYYPVSKWIKHKIKRHDVVLISTKNMHTKQLKRVIGMPGDTIIIKNYELLNPEDFKIIKKPYVVKSKVKTVPWEKWGISSAIATSNKNEWIVGLNTKEKPKLLEKRAFIEGVRQTNKFLEKGNYIKQIPNWDNASFGPIAIPKKGQEMVLNEGNWVLYMDVFRNENMHIDSLRKVMTQRKKVSIAPQNNYYFVLGDNRGIGVDSRYFGFLTNKDIIGIVGNKLFTPNKLKVTQPLLEE